MNRRKFLQALFAVPLVAAPLLHLPSLRCDADYIEEAWRERRVVRGERLVCRRTVKAADWAGMEDCQLIALHDSGTIIDAWDLKEGFIHSCHFMSREYASGRGLA